jgi:hypothetical protein
MTEIDTLTIVRRRLADGRTIADSYVRALVAQIDQLKVELIEAIERGNDWCDQAQKARAERDLGRSIFNTALRRAQAAEAERDRLRDALERAADTLSDASLLDAWADARAALKETDHD